MGSCVVAVICIVICAFHSTQGAGWTYTERDAWNTKYSGCGGKKQSPIDLRDKDVFYDDGLKKFEFTGFNSANGLAAILSNNGHSVVMTYTAGQQQVFGGSLYSTYQVVQYHFHWGGDNAQGSEHTVNRLASPMEVHIVCYNTKYADFGTAIGFPDGLAVLGFFFEISQTDNPTIQKIVDALPSILLPGNQTSFTPFPLDDLMAGTTKYYRYQGGLTTPMCNEIVTWTVFNDPITLSNKQMQEFRKLTDSDGVLMVNNYRKPQALNQRDVRASFSKDGFQVLGASSAASASLALVLSLLLASLWSNM